VRATCPEKIATAEETLLIAPDSYKLSETYNKDIFIGESTVMLILRGLVCPADVYSGI
jgi:hypothetical protein